MSEDVPKDKSMEMRSGLVTARVREGGSGRNKEDGTGYGVSFGG
jgi:hypothetical protein